jgi:hypothetical protein
MTRRRDLTPSPRKLRANSLLQNYGQPSAASSLARILKVSNEQRPPRVITALEQMYNGPIRVPEIPDRTQSNHSDPTYLMNYNSFPTTASEYLEPDNGMPAPSLMQNSQSIHKAALLTGAL